MKNIAASQSILSQLGFSKLNNHSLMMVRGGGDNPPPPPSGNGNDNDQGQQHPGVPSPK